MRYPLHRRLERLASDRWARRGLRTLLRSAWLGLSLFCLGLGANLLLNWDLSVALLLAVVLGCVALGGLLLLTRRMPPQDAARRLDERFELHEQLITALEVSQQEAPEGVAARLLEQANTTTTQIQRYVNRQKRQPWVEMAALLAIALLAGGLFLIIDLTPPGPLPTAEALPQLDPPPQSNDPAAQQPPPDANQGGSDQTEGQNGQAQVAQAGGIDQASAAALADALRDQSVTRPAAEALDKGNTSDAAQVLRELADQAGELSDETRRDLADELRQAASEIEPGNPELADQIRESAYGMQQSEQSTAEAFENLADAVEQLDSSNGQQTAQGQQNPSGQQQQGQSPGGGGAGNTPPGEQREQPESSERLGVDGVPLELESRGSGQPTDGDAENSTSGAGTFQAEQGGQPDDATVQIGKDPLRIPAELRDVVQEYFSSNR